MAKRQAGREDDRQNAGGFQNFYNSLQVKLFGLIFCLLILQCTTVLEVHFVDLYQVNRILRCV